MVGTAEACARALPEGETAPGMGRECNSAGGKYMGIQIKRIGHVGLLVSDFERSFQFYTEVLGCKVTNRNKRADGSESAFLRFDDMHHDFVIASAPQGVDVTAAGPRERLIQQIAFEVEDRDAFLK